MADGRWLKRQKVSLSDEREHGKQTLASWRCNSAINPAMKEIQFMVFTVAMDRGLIVLKKHQDVNKRKVR